LKVTAKKCEQCGEDFSPQSEANKYCDKDCWKASGAKIQGSLDKSATVTHREDGWHVLSEKGKNLGGPYKSKEEAVKRLRQVEYFKHHGSLKPFSKKADVLTDHITDMKGRMDQVQERLQTVPAVKTADATNAYWDAKDIVAYTYRKMAEQDPQRFANFVLGGMSEQQMTEEAQIMVNELAENAPWIKNDPEWIKLVNEYAGKSNKQADQVTDETETLTTNDPNAIQNSFTPDPTAPPTFKNVQPTDNDNLEIPVAKPTSPPAPGQAWVFDPVNKQYVSMPDPANAAKTI